MEWILTAAISVLGVLITAVVMRFRFQTREAHFIATERDVQRLQIRNGEIERENRGSR